ncbi:MAG: ABC transporter ATP-binding protein [Lachnospiraceae bacterium]|nr:ABC transporter ATP-binding protein [Lachnospiraceae bacterium]
MLYVIIRKVTVYFREVFEKYDDLNASVRENVSAVRVVKAYVREEYEKSRFDRAVEKLYEMFIKAESLIISNMPVMQATVYICILLISWLGARAILSDELTTGELMSLLTYCMNILMSLMMLSMIFVMITMSFASAQRITEVIREDSDLKEPEDPVMTVVDGSVDFVHVNFGYNKTAEEYVLKDVTLHVKAGEMIGIIGGTGSAKSSLVNLIPRLYDVSDGEVRVGGVDVRKYDIVTLRDQVSMVLQQNNLFSGSILENLRWGNEDATEEECREACRMAQAAEFIERMPDGYDTHIERGGVNVSGGQKQRLCIARALVKKPRVIIFDDSTSAVDTATDAKIRKAINEEIPDTTVFIIAQRISSVQQADRIIVMDDGRISAIGTHEELLKTSEIYRDVYESQTGGTGDFDSPFS